MLVEQQQVRSSSCREFHSSSENQKQLDTIKYNDLNPKQRINEESIAEQVNAFYTSPISQMQKYEQLENMINKKLFYNQYCNIPIPATKINLNLHFQIQKNVDVQKRQSQTKIIRSRKVEPQQQETKNNEKQGYNPNYGVFQKFPKRTQSSDAVVRRRLIQSSELKHRKFVRTQSEQQIEYFYKKNL